MLIKSLSFVIPAKASDSVIPAKAGIQGLKLDSCFRRNDNAYYKRFINVTNH